MIHKHLLDALNAYEESHDRIGKHATEAAKAKGHRPPEVLTNATLPPDTSDAASRESR